MTAREQDSEFDPRWTEGLPAHTSEPSRASRALQPVRGGELPVALVGTFGALVGLVPAALWSVEAVGESSWTGLVWVPVLLTCAPLLGALVPGILSVAVGPTSQRIALRNTVLASLAGQLSWAIIALAVNAVLIPFGLVLTLFTYGLGVFVAVPLACLAPLGWLAATVAGSVRVLRTGAERYPGSFTWIR